MIQPALNFLQVSKVQLGAELPACYISSAGVRWELGGSRSPLEMPAAGHSLVLARCHAHRSGHQRGRLQPGPCQPELPPKQQGRGQEPVRTARGLPGGQPGSAWEGRGLQAPSSTIYQAFAGHLLCAMQGMAADLGKQPLTAPMSPATWTLASSSRALPSTPTHSQCPRPPSHCTAFP